MLLTALGFSAGVSADVLLLHNDNIVEGTVVRTDSDFAVRDDRGNVRYVATTQVMYRCRTRSEAYRWKRRRIERTDVRGHIRLAQWCLSNKLPHEASDQLLHLTAIAPNHASLRMIERRLRNYHRDSQVRSQTVLPVAYQKPIRDEPPATRDISDAVVAEFKRSVQPILVNRCGQIACHGSGSESDFRLNIHRNRVLGRELTTRNLHLVSTFVEPENVENSRFLRFARTQHGPMRSPPIGPHEFDMYQNLLRWAKKIGADGEENTIPANDDISTERTASDVVPSPAERLLASQEKRTDDSLDDSLNAGSVVLIDPTIPTDSESSDGIGPAVRSNGPAPPEPKPAASNKTTDPYDPEAFNAKFHSGP